jgi:hypothetical protein
MARRSKREIVPLRRAGVVLAGLSLLPGSAIADGVIADPGAPQAAAGGVPGQVSPTSPGSPAAQSGEAGAEPSAPPAPDPGSAPDAPSVPSDPPSQESADGAATGHEAAGTPEAPSPEPATAAGPAETGTPASGGPPETDRSAPVVVRSVAQRALTREGSEKRARKQSPRTKVRTRDEAAIPPAVAAPIAPGWDASATFPYAERAPIAVPSALIEQFRIPLFLLPIYQAAGIEYGVRWEILAAINEIETDYGRNLNVSSAGAVGWMQFMPATWKTYGVDANRDGRKDPYNPVDAIFAAARYLRAAEAEKDIRKAIFAYNHADWYVDSVLLRARLISGLPGTLVGALAGLAEGRSPMAGRVVRTRKGVNLVGRAGTPVVAVQDGRIVRIGHHARLGRFIQLRDVYGNTYTYGRLKKIAKAYPAPKERRAATEAVRRELKLPRRDPKPTRAATAGRRVVPAVKRVLARATKERLFANPGRRGAFRAGGEEQLLDAGMPLPGGTERYIVGRRVASGDLELRRLRVGAQVVAGTVLGRIGELHDGRQPRGRFEIRPAGADAPRIDPEPILKAWRLRTKVGASTSSSSSAGSVLLLSKAGLQRRVLADPALRVYGCGRRDVRAGFVDRRVLATLAFLSASGLKPTVTSLRCGHARLTSSGNVSHHTSGNALDIAAINGIPISGHQGPGSITDVTIRRLLLLQGSMRPDQIISLMSFANADNTVALPDHADHIHVGFRPLYGSNPKLGRQAAAVLRPAQWAKLVDRLDAIERR